MSENAYTAAPSYERGLADGRRFREMEKRGWVPSDTLYLALLSMEDADFYRGFELGIHTDPEPQHNDGT